MHFKEVFIMDTLWDFIMLVILTTLSTSTGMMYLNLVGTWYDSPINIVFWGELGFLVLTAYFAGRVIRALVAAFLRSKRARKPMMK